MHEESKHDFDHSWNNQESEEFEFVDAALGDSFPEKSEREGGIDSGIDDDKFERD